MKIPMKYTHFGWKFLSKVSVSTTHSGVDLNHGAPQSDRGMPIIAMAEGEVVYSRNTGDGWGKMVVIYHPKYKVWSRYAHLNTIEVVFGQKVKEGQKIGTCGSTGGNWAPHLHWDVIKKKLPKWTSYTKWWSQKKVMDYYVDPIPYVNGINKTENQEKYHFPESAKWVKENGISNGKNPSEECTREEVWEMLYRYHNNNKLP